MQHVFYVRVSVFSVKNDLQTYFNALSDGYISSFTPQVVLKCLQRNVDQISLLSIFYHLFYPLMFIWDSGERRVFLRFEADKAGNVKTFLWAPGDCDGMFLGCSLNSRLTVCFRATDL